MIEKVQGVQKVREVKKVRRANKPKYGIRKPAAFLRRVSVLVLLLLSPVFQGSVFATLSSEIANCPRDKSAHLSDQAFAALSSDIVSCLQGNLNPVMTVFAEEAVESAGEQVEIGPGVMLKEIYKQREQGETSEETTGETKSHDAAMDAALQVRETRQATEEEINTYFSNAVFVGDSIMEGFQTYCLGRRSNPFLAQFNFLCRVSFSLHNAFWPISSKTKHPIYQGTQRYIWDSVQMVGARQVYMMFGQNDLDMGNDSVEKYCQLIAKIKEQSPEASFVIMSMTYTLAGKGKGPINNDNIRVFNTEMQRVAAENGWDFIDMTTPLSDGNGNLRPDYCSDHYVHLTNAAYGTWAGVLREYAARKIAEG